MLTTHARWFLSCLASLFNSKKINIMAKFYSTFSVVKFTKSLLLAVFFLCAHNLLQAQVYYTSLSGAIEVPSNTSPGTGKAIVTIDGNNMRVQVTFSGLVAQTAAGAPSGVTASHIHAATPIPLSVTSTAGVATSVPTFTGFPSGVREGTYDRTFDMTLASSFNPAYVTANGGTPASAFTALKTAIAAGRSYLNVHSNAFPGGEIRGFLLPCPTITVTIPDAWALAQGTLANTVYPPYSPATSLTLQANVSGGTTPYTYNWSNGGSGSSITVSPTVTTNYSVTVKDVNGCPGNIASKTVNVINIAGGNKGQNFLICHKGRTLAVGVDGVSDHLGHGDMLSGCTEQGQSVTGREIVAEHISKDALTVRVLSNPSSGHFDLQLSGSTENKIQLRVYDLQGRVVEAKQSLNANQTLRLGTSYRPGVYLVQINQGTETQTVKLIKAN